MKNTRDVVNLEVGQQLDLAATDGGTKRAYGSNGHGLYVISVDPDNGAFEVGTSPVPYTGSNSVAVTDAADGIPGALVNDFIYVAGDLNLCMHGIKDWLPSTVASNDSYCGVNRYQHKVRLAGHYIDATDSNSIGSAIQLAASRIFNHGGVATHAVVDPIRFAQLSIEQEDKKRITVMSTSSTIGYTGLSVATAAGELSVVSDMDCPSDEMYILDADSWILGSVKDPVRIWDDDGLGWLRAASNAGMEVRLHSFAGLICTMPRNNARVAMITSG